MIAYKSRLFQIRGCSVAHSQKFTESVVSEEKNDGFWLVGL